MAETLSQGVIIPQGGDAIDATGVAADRALGTSINAALSEKAATSALSPTDLNTVKVAGVYRMGAPYPSGYSNTPPGNTTASVLLVIGGPAPATWAAQEVYQYGTTPRRWWRMSASQTTWNDWVEITAGGGGGGPSDIPTNALATGGREMRMQLFRDAYPLVSTGNKGVVVFRYDHGLTNFKNVLKPLHDTYGIPAYVAMNSRNWDLAENSGATQAEAASWSNVEWGNHSATHNDKTGINDIYEAVALGRIELEAQVGKTVHGWTVPGLPGADGNSYDKLDGFGVGYASGFSNSYAGSLILNHHAIASGVIGPQFRVLDGEIRQGGRHHGWENKTFPEIKALIDEAVSTKTALTLMQHPRTMNLSGYWTPALADQVLAYVKSLIDAGQLANLSYYQSHRAQLGPVGTTGPSEPPIYRSGLRDISGELRDGWTGSLFVEREGSNVYYRGTINGSAATSSDPWLIPSGFRCTSLKSALGPYDYGAGVAYTGDNPAKVFRINHYLNRFRVENSQGTTANISINHSYRTIDAIPTLLPGA